MKEKYLDMKDNLIDIIKEEQAKLGYRKESIRLYYPLGSLKHLLKADADIEKMREVLDDFCDEVKEFFGQIEVTNNGERFCFKVPDAGVEYVHENGKLPVVNFAAGGVATPADAALMMQLGAEGVFVGSGIFKSGDPAKRAAAIVKAVTNFQDAKMLAELSTDLGEAMVGINEQEISLLMAERGK